LRFEANEVCAVKNVTSILFIMLMIVSSCSQKYAPEPMDEFDELTDSSAREEVREIFGTFWCNAYGNYFEPEESGEIWCTYGGALCTRYENELEDAEAADSTIHVSPYVDVVLSGFIGDYLDESFEPDCDRPFYVTSLHRMRARRIIRVHPHDRLVPPLGK
jgi:hypothetical protein